LETIDLMLMFEVSYWKSARISKIIISSCSTTKNLNQQFKFLIWITLRLKGIFWRESTSVFLINLSQK
jgi:hypothetical protein